ncbi:MAG: AraC family transcriptional regulator [Saprospiraceae bacterium]|nr:AraC family transcriptional regulator [Saprospiraceae bacterium]
MREIKRVHTITEVHEIYGYEKPKHPLVTVLPIDERMMQFDYGEINYAFDFYQISLKEGVRGTFSYGRNDYDFQEGTMTFIKPDQVVKVERSQMDTEGGGWTLIFHPDLLRKSPLGRTIEEYSFFNYEVREALHLSDDEKKSLTDLAEKIKAEYQQNIDKHSQDIIIANIEMILKYCKRYYDRQFYTRTNLNKDFVSKFEEVMREYYQSEKPSELGVLSVKYCAQALAMSSNYFGDLIKNETGRSAKEHIQTYIIEKAKTKIVGSSASISEIAYDLGFEYPQGFNKLFKARTGINPSQYRRLN